MEKCRLYDSWAPSFVTALPAWWRFIQCIRRFYDTRHSHPHLTNSVKYALSLSAIIFSVCSKFDGSLTLKVFWLSILALLVFSALASVFAFAWDVYFDWGLLSKNEENPYLRKEITFPRWFYFFAIGMDAVLRFTWIVLLSPNYWQTFTVAPVIVYGLALFEIVRRAIWVLIRMENEHANNVGQYRVTKDLPMPFAIARSSMP